MKKELLIFGADGALGRGVAKVLTGKNYDRIYLLDFKFSKKDYPGNVEFIEYKDLSKEENIIEIFKKISSGKDKNLFLFSTVGGFSGGPKTWEQTIEDWDKMFSLNLKTSFLIVKHFALKVKESNSGSILLTSAYTAVMPEIGKSAYGASKRSLLSLVETLSLEGEEINLTANALTPFIIDTPANRSWDPEADTGGWIKPSEVGEFAHCIFENYHFLSGNIFKLKIRLRLSN